MSFEKVDGFDAIFRGQDTKTFAFQNGDAQLAQHLFVFDQQNRLRDALLCGPPRWSATELSRRRCDRKIDDKVVPAPGSLSTWTKPR